MQRCSSTSIFSKSPLSTVVATSSGHYSTTAFPNRQDRQSHDPQIYRGVKLEKLLPSISRNTRIYSDTTNALISLIARGSSKCCANPSRIIRNTVIRMQNAQLNRSVFKLTKSFFFLDSKGNVCSGSLKSLSDAKVELERRKSRLHDATMRYDNDFKKLEKLKSAAEKEGPQCDSVVLLHFVFGEKIARFLQKLKSRKEMETLLGQLNEQLGSSRPGGSRDIIWRIAYLEEYGLRYIECLEGLSFDSVHQNSCLAACTKYMEIKVSEDKDMVSELKQHVEDQEILLQCIIERRIEEESKLSRVQRRIFLIKEWFKESIPGRGRRT